MKLLALALLLVASPAEAGDKVPMDFGADLTVALEDLPVWVRCPSQIFRATPYGSYECLPAMEIEPAPVNDTVAIIIVGPYVTTAEMTAAACDQAKAKVIAFYENHKRTSVICIPRSGQ